MGKKIKNNEKTILSSMEEVVVLAKANSLTPEFYAKANDSLSYISKALGLSQEEAMLLSLFFEKSSSPRIWISNLAEMINVSNIRIISMMNVADGLMKKGYLKGSANGEDRYYSVPGYIIDSIRMNQPFTPKPLVNLSMEDFFDRLGDMLDDTDGSLWQRYDQLSDLYDGNMHLSYCKIVRSYELDHLEFVVFNVFVHRLVNEDDDMIGTSDWDDYVDNNRNVRRLLKSLKSGESGLIKKEIFEPKIQDGMREANFYHLTDKAKEELFPNMGILEKNANKDKYLISHTSFAPKQLYYPSHIQTQIDRLAELLQPENFKLVTQRLKENGMRQGFACLFHGAPGTGKSETVYQLARITGRDVLQVDVTQIKSCWVGESEQNIKALFDRYRRMVKEREVAPILLFNEADAVLGIRQEGAHSAVDKMENSIQNIILQEIESLEGIILATTNLTCNLDSAFERRFIYKIEFERPTLETKQKIWQAMIPSLSDKMAFSLAKDFDLSGGQIENVVRKRTVEYILSGNEPSEEQMREFCQTETIDSKQGKRVRIGF